MKEKFHLFSVVPNERVTWFISGKKENKKSFT